MSFNEEEYKKLLRTNYPQAVKMLEKAILLSRPENVASLCRLRAPGVITLMELDRLKRAGFDANKLTPQGEPEILVMAYKAGAEHANRHWPDKVADYYDMSKYVLSEGAAA